jgi:hypothetical protein
VIAASRRQPLSKASPDLAAMARDVPVYLGGPGADARLVDAIGGRLLEGGPTAAARALTV